MRKVRLSQDAASYARSEAAYLRAHSPASARRFLQSLKRLKDNLGRFPKLGHIGEPALVPGVFRFVLDDYLIDYQVRDDIVEVLAIRHARQKPLDLVVDDDFDFERP